jgi:hypothetical protein
LVVAGETPSVHLARANVNDLARFEDDRREVDLVESLAPRADQSDMEEDPAGTLQQFVAEAPAQFSRGSDLDRKTGSCRRVAAISRCRLPAAGFVHLSSFDK